MRSENVATFRDRILQAKNAYSSSADYYRSTKERGAELRCRGWVQLLRFFLATNPSAKKHSLDESWQLTKRALEVFSRNANDIEFVNTYDQLALSVGLGYDFHWDLKTRLRKIEEGIEYGRRAIKLLSPSGDARLLTRVCVRVALFLDIQGDYPSRYDVGKLDQEALGYWRTGERLDRRTALLQMGYPPPGFYRLLSDREGAEVCRDSLKLAREAGDNFATGWLSDQAAVRLFFEALRHPDDAEETRVLHDALKLAEEAQHRHSILGFVTPNCGVLWPRSPQVEYFKQLARYEKDPAKRRALLAKSLSETHNLFNAARSSGYPVVNAYSQRMASIVFRELAECTADPAGKRRLLRRALEHARKTAAIVMKAKRDEIGPVSTILRNQAQITSALADLEPNYRGKIKLLRAAIKASERGILLYTKYLENVSRGQPHILQRVGGRYQLEHGDMLTRLYNVTRDETLLSRIARTYSDAANTFKPGDPTKELGLAYWKAAEACDLQQANIAAADFFALAAKAYQSIKDKNPRIVSIFHEYANYMEAWSNIEQARAAHRKLANQDARKFYEKAASLHRTAGRWSFLAPYYEALAMLESAENLSRSGDSSAAIKSFGDASERFRESSALIKGSLASFDESPEKSSIEALVVSFNEEYCRGRLLIEEARRAEDQGDHQTSAERFYAAAQILANSARSTRLRRERNDLLYIATLAKAWGEIARSYESKDSSGRFRNAVSLFEKSLDYSPDEIAKNVSLGHGYFCQALAANDEFQYTLSSIDYENAAKYYTAASSHFARAGFNVEATHVHACKLLLDAHSEVVKIRRDSDLAENAKTQRIAIGLLREAAEAFSRSQQTAKQRQVLSLLSSVNEWQGFFRRLVTTSKSLSRVSPTVAFPTPVARGESPVGHSMFTGSNIDVDYSSSVVPGSEGAGEMLIELRVANIGTETIQVVRIENVLPDAARVASVPVDVRLDHGSIISSRKVLRPLNVETYQFVLDGGGVPLIIKPRVVYTDEKGREESRELPAKVVGSSPLLDYLVNEFVADCTSKNLATPHAGWRTLTDIAAATKVPRSQLYGDSRWGHTFGRPFEILIKSGIVECRTFPGERGRGGQIRKVRLAHETEIAKRYVSEHGQAQLG